MYSLFFQLDFLENICYEFCFENDVGFFLYFSNEIDLLNFKM